MRRRRATRWTLDVDLLVRLYLLAGAAIALGLCLHRLGDRPLVGALDDRARLAVWLGAALLAAAILALARALRRSVRRPNARIAPTLAIHAIGIGLALATAEAAVRGLETPGPEGPELAGATLWPRSWERVVDRYTGLIERAERDGAYLVPDPHLGWTVGRSRESEDGLYRSSAEGLRSHEVGVSLADARPARRIALVGDSYTFCEEVPFEACWADHLDRRLGPDVQVLDFGVPGYGVDQAVERYRHDVRPWRPDVVVLAVFPHDLYRSQTVYPFVSFPTWDYPFAKPRFVLEDGRLRNLVPEPLAPRAVFAHDSVFDLPWIHLDAGFLPQQWEAGPLDASHLVRAVRSRLPAAWTPPDAVSRETGGALNAALVGAFLDAVRADGAVPVVLHLPAREEFADEDIHAPEEAESLGRWRAALGGPALDATPVVREIPPARRYLEIGRHFTPETNERVAEWLLGPLRARLARGEPDPAGAVGR